MNNYSRLSFHEIRSDYRINERDLYEKKSNFDSQKSVQITEILELSKFELKKIDCTTGLSQPEQRISSKFGKLPLMRL